MRYPAVKTRRQGSLRLTALCIGLVACAREDASPSRLGVASSPVAQSASSVAVAQSASSVAVDLCAAVQFPRISRDSIGPLSLSLPLGELRSICNTARDTVHEGEATAYAAIMFPMRDLAVVGWQYRESLDARLPADVWVVMGSRALLPEGVSISEQWEHVHAAYGDAVGHVDFGTTVMFCRLPYLFFKFDADPDEVGPIWDGDFSKFPREAQIREVSLLRDGAAGWRCQSHGP